MKKENFCEGWSFCKIGSDGNGTGEKRIMHLPHDAMIEECRIPDSPGGSSHAYFPGGIYRYEKTFSVPHDWAQKTAVFQFEGVYQKAKVFINGKEAGGRSYGYIPFFVNTDGLLNYGEENTICVTADNSQLPNSRWYTGSGIYRPVWLWLGDKSHINIEGVKISTLSYSPARIQVETAHTGGAYTGGAYTGGAYTGGAYTGGAYTGGAYTGGAYTEGAHTGGEISAEIFYGEKSVVSGKGNSIILEIPDAKLWSDETPALYECRVRLTENGEIKDEASETFGIRLIEWNAKGLFVNGNETLLRGGCIHHDNGILGARSFAEAEDRRIRILKEAGYNAIRSAHNPAASSLLDACDKYGMYVMDETWDVWYSRKSKFDYAADFPENYRFDIETMVHRDFNHPSVIMYSLGNEISEPHEEKGITLLNEMIGIVKAIDKTRVVTCGVNLWLISMASKGKAVFKESGEGVSNTNKTFGSTLFNLMATMMGSFINKAANSKKADKVTSPCLDALDIAGYNYASGRYPLEAKAHPNRIVVGSETFPPDIAKNWAMVKKYPYLIGDFMWVAWDYLGEVGIGAWSFEEDGKAFYKPHPWLVAGSGAIDILGNIGAEAEYAAAVWGLRDKPYIGVRPVNHPGVKPSKSAWRMTNAIASWSWKNCEGNKAVVEVYSDAASVELRLNSKKIGRKKLKDYKAIFNTRFSPGTLSAVAYNAEGREVSRSSLVSADKTTGIKIIPEKENAKSGEVLFINVNLCDKNGTVECNADTSLTISVENGELLAFGSANPRTEENYLSGSFNTYYGHAQAVIKTKNQGMITVKAQSDGLETTTAIINVI